MSFCPCGSQKTYEQCCKRYHEGLAAENALALMRSRYSAYALHLVPYIVQTTHPHNPAPCNIEEIEQFMSETFFDRLEILEFIDGEKLATVVFTAYLRQNGYPMHFTEKSLFERVNDRWLYLKGEVYVS